jgi:predicted nucleic acid-binding protein
VGLILFDTTFFVDLDRETRRRQRGPAMRFLEKHPEDEMAMSVITWGELARGFDDRAEWEAFGSGFLILPLDDAVIWHASVLFNELRKGGALIADNDLWIGATAACHGLALATDNDRHFVRIPGLRVFDYRHA